MAKCWEIRGCDDEMQADCPHPVDLKDNCPTKCAFAVCTRTTHKIADDDLLFDFTVDRSVVIKDECLLCEFFLTHGPRIAI